MSVVVDRLDLRHTVPRTHDLQSLVEGRDQRESNPGCVGLHDALKCTSEAILTVMKNSIADQKLLRQP